MSLDSIFDLLSPILIDILNDRMNRIGQIGEQLVKGGYVNMMKE